MPIEIELPFYLFYSMTINLVAGIFFTTLAAKVAWRLGVRLLMFKIAQKIPFFGQFLG